MVADPFRHEHSDGDSVHVPLVSYSKITGYALVDTDDAPMVLGYRWHLMRLPDALYASTTTSRDDGATTVLMHRLIAHTAPGLKTDHWNGDGLDNRRSNLRPCTHTQNMQNRKVSKLSTIGFKGVSRHKNGYRACIAVAGKRLRLGNFSTAVDAADAYNRAAVEHFGEFARLNDLSEGAHIAAEESRRHLDNLVSSFSDSSRPESTSLRRATRRDIDLLTAEVVRLRAALTVAQGASRQS